MSQKSQTLKTENKNPLKTKTEKKLDIVIIVDEKKVIPTKNYIACLCFFITVFGLGVDLSMTRN